MLIVYSDGKSINKISFSEKREKSDTSCSVIEDSISQLEEYFSGKRFIFELPLDPHGTDFQKKVWNKLVAIPYGQTVTYKDIALITGDVNNVRAVGTSNGKNPIAVIIPCHRVIGTNGKLTGYAGGLWRKKWLLNHEQNYLPDPGKLF